MFGASVLRRLLFRGPSLIAGQRTPSCEFTTQQLFVWMEVQMEWWWCLVEERVILQLCMILGDWEDIEMADGIGSKHLISPRLFLQLLDTSILLCFLVHWCLWSEEEQIQSEKLWLWKFMTQNLLNGLSLILSKDSDMSCGQLSKQFIFMVDSNK